MDIQPHSHESNVFNATFFRYQDTQLCEAGAAASALEAFLYDDLAAPHIAERRTSTLLFARRMNVVRYPAPNSDQEVDPSAVLRSQPVTLSRESLALLGTAAAHFVTRTPDEIRRMSLQGKNEHERATREVEVTLAKKIMKAIKAAGIKYTVIDGAPRQRFPVGFTANHQALADDGAAKAAVALVEDGGLAGSNSANGLG